MFSSSSPVRELAASSCLFTGLTENASTGAELPRLPLSPTLVPARPLGCNPGHGDEHHGHSGPRGSVRSSNSQLSSWGAEAPTCLNRQMGKMRLREAWAPGQVREQGQSNRETCC